MSGQHRGTKGPSHAKRYAALTVGAIAVIAVVIAAALWYLRPSPTPPTAIRERVSSSPTATPPPSGVCADQTTAPFAPTKMSVPGAFSDAPVLALPRDSHGVPSIPPVTNTGKREVAWDRPPGTEPGAPTGNVLLNVHTWPDGTGLGNQLLGDLDQGGRIVLRDADDVLCYRVSKRVQVPAGTLIPALYKTGGTPQLVIIACSGKRLGPANWTHRTLWYAEPESASDSPS